MPDIKTNILHIQQHIHRQDITVLAVSKAQSIEKIREAYLAGIDNFGENYLQEAIDKIEKMQNCHWHYIGHIQSNKCKKISQYFSWVHTVDRIEIAKLLDKANQSFQKKQNICIQINLFNEPQKSGITPDHVKQLITEILQLPHLHLRGLMTILPDHFTAPEQLQAYQQLAALLAKLNQTLHLNMDTLSMGMSGDYLQAIAAGSTMIRLGQAIFGERK